MRARIVLAAATGTANERIAAQLRVHRMTVLLSRGRLERERMAGLADEPRPGREPTHDRAARDRVIALAADLKEIERAYPQGDLAVVLDNVSSHKTRPFESGSKPIRE
jgi:transposase